MAELLPFLLFGGIEWGRMRQTLNCNYRCQIAILLFLLASPQAAESQLWANGMRTVVLSGDVAADAGDEVAFRSFYGAAIDSHGELTFAADLADSNGVRLTVPRELDPDVDGIEKTRDMGIWREISGTLSLVMRQGREVLGTTDGSIGWLIDPHDDNGGDYSFRVSNDTVLINALGSDSLDLQSSRVEQRVWQFDRDGSTHIVTTGSNGLDGSERFHADLGGMNNNGRYLIAARTIALTNVNDQSYSLWVSSADGGFDVLAKDDDPAPGTDVGIAFRQPGQVAAINRRGQVAFASLTTSRDDISSPQPRFVNGVWLTSEGEDSQLIALTKAEDPSLRITSGDIRYIDVNAHGDVAFSQVTSVWKHDNTSGLQQVLSYMEPVTLGESTGTLRFQDVYVADEGTVSFRATFIDGEDSNVRPTTLWGERDGSIISVAYPGQQLETFDGAELLTVHESMHNSRGQVVFRGSVAEPDSDEFFVAILADDLSGRLHSIVRTGELLEVLPGDFRQVDYALVEGINERGQIAIELNFTDGSGGLFVSNLVTVPEAGTPVGILFATLLVLRRSRRGNAPHDRASGKQNRANGHVFGFE